MLLLAHPPFPLHTPCLPEDINSSHLSILCHFLFSNNQLASGYKFSSTLPPIPPLLHPSTTHLTQPPHPHLTSFRPDQISRSEIIFAPHHRSQGTILAPLIPRFGELRDRTLPTPSYEQAKLFAAFALQRHKRSDHSLTSAIPSLPRRIHSIWYFSTCDSLPENNPGTAALRSHRLDSSPHICQSNRFLGSRLACHKTSLCHRHFLVFYLANTPGTGTTSFLLLPDFRSTWPDPQNSTLLPERTETLTFSTSSLRSISSRKLNSKSSICRSTTSN